MIKVLKNWYIEADSFQYILYKRVIRTNQKTGEEYESRTECTYHSSVSSCLQCLMVKLHRKKIMKHDMALQEALNEFKRIEKMVLKSAEGKEI